jgi:putative hydrolase of the HAD superfamily
MPLLFVFDMDDVLYDYDWRVRMTGLTELTGVEFAELRRRWWHPEGEWAAEAGRYPDGASYLAAVTEAIGAPISVDQWIANRAAAMTPRREVLDLVARASEWGRVSLLTNNGPLIGEHLPAIAPDLAPLIPLDDLRTSSFYGARKPDPVVFQRLLESYDEPAEHVFFTDDLAENVEGARSIGITAHRYRDPGGLLVALEDFARARIPVE